MKKLYFNLLLIISFLFVLTSCTTRYKFVTRGLPETDSSYLISKMGERINATSIEVRPSGVKVDGKYYPTTDLAAIKSKKMYFVFNDGRMYFTDIYGKINLLYTVSYTHTYGTGTQAGTSSKNVTYYLQRERSANVDQLTHATFLEYVEDNEEALSLAKAHYIWHYTTYASFGTFAVGTILLVKTLGADKTFGDYAGPLALVGGSFVLHGVLSGISNHKLRKSIEVYNGQ